MNRESSDNMQSPNKNWSNTSSRPLSPWFVISLWMSLGTSMIIFNKAILSTWHFNFPFFLTAWHCLVASILTQAISLVFPDFLPGVKEEKVTRSIYLYKVLPMSLCFAYSLAAGNMAYAYLSVAYIQMLKSFTPVPMLFMSYITGRESPSIVQLSLVLMISTGVALASVGEARFSLIGFFLQLSAVFADVTRTTLVDLTLQDLKLDSLSLLYYLMPPSCMFISLGYYFHESNHFDWKIVLETTFGWVILANGMLSFLLNVAVVLLVKHTSPVTLSLSGIVKDIALVISSAVIFQSPISSLQILGYSVSIIGLSVYRGYRQDPSILSNPCARLNDLYTAVVSRRMSSQMSKLQPKKSKGITPSIPGSGTDLENNHEEEMQSLIRSK